MHGRGPKLLHFLIERVDGSGIADGGDRSAATLDEFGEAQDRRGELRGATTGLGDRSPVYGISRQLLLGWRKAWASNHPAGEDSIGPTFVPAIVAPSTPPTKEAVEAGQIEIVSPKGLRVVFGPGADVEAVVRIARGLER